MPQKKNLYGILGVSPGETSTDILRLARKRMAMKMHTDRGGSGEVIREINWAFEVLSNPYLRMAYNRFGEEGVMMAEKVKQSLGGNEVSGEAFLQEVEEALQRMCARTEEHRRLWQEVEQRPRGGNKDTGSDKWDQRAVEGVSIAKSDIGLLMALYEAYLYIGDGRWQVKEAGENNHRFKDGGRYIVTKLSDDRVMVLRRIDDWRDGINKEKPIEIRGVSGQGEKVSKILPSNAYLEEGYLCNFSKGQLVESGVVPTGYGGYIGALKSMARKWANEGGLATIKDEESNKIICRGEW